jgi:trans-aconitate methyltransferase
VSVASHLGIKISQYDRRIRTFIPDYEEMLDVAARAVPANTGVILDLGVGTGALSARCLKRAVHARVVGLDADPAILAVAKRRLGARATLTATNFLTARLRRADVIVSSFALHHIRTRSAKLRMHRRIRKALRRGGCFLIVDSHPATSRAASADQMRQWDAHLRATYSKAEARKIFASWADEDVYVPLIAETAMLERAGFTVDVLWRKGAFAVLRCS